MSSMLIAVAFFCASVGCTFIADTKRTYSRQEDCIKATERLASEIWQHFPDAQIKATCIPMEGYI